MMTKASSVKKSNRSVSGKQAPRLELPDKTFHDARQAAIRAALAKILPPIMGTDEPIPEDISIESPHCLGRVALALKLVAETLGGPDGLSEFEYGFQDDRCHGGGELDGILFSNEF